MDLQALLDTLISLPIALTLTILFLSSTIEYLFPPFPGDSVTLAGAVLASYADYSIPAVFTAVTAGSLLGAMLVFRFGKALHAWQTRRFGEDSELTARIDRLATSFRRFGSASIAINRFLPGIRSFIFIAAGVAELPALRVGLYATISLVLWNGLIIALGLLIGSNVERLQTLMTRFSMVGWSVLGLLAIIMIARWILRRDRQ
jgi:membrane protein DedA with SNARE-associated domain